MSVNKYLEARNHKFSVGMRFKMRFEGDEAPERRFSGTIIGVGDSASSRWADSEWRSLKVQWDEPSSVPRPERVSPWELEPLVATTPSISQPVPRNKRARPLVSPSIPHDLPAFGLSKSADKSSLSYSGIQRGRDVLPSPNSTPLFSPLPKVSSYGYSGSSNAASVAGNPMFWSNQVEAPSEAVTNTVITRESGERKRETGNGYRLFGIQLVNSSPMEEAKMATTGSGVGEDLPVHSFDVDSDRQSQPSNTNHSDMPAFSSEPEKSCLRSPQEMQSRQIRSCTKVHMQGVAVGRAVDLTRFDCYNDLLGKLEEMFEIDGDLCGPTKKWQVAYTDDEDDMMQLGDDPWHEFCSMVKKIFIYSCEEAKRLPHKAKLPINAEIKPGKPAADGDVAPSASDDQP